MTLTEVLVVVVVLAVLAAVFLPAFISDRPVPAYRINCVNNLKQDNLAFLIWAEDHSSKFPMEISVANGGTMELAATGDVVATFRVMTNILTTPKILLCPADTNHVLAKDFGANFTIKNISYFVGLDADTNHSRAFLSGDDNFAIGGNATKSGLMELSTNTPITWTAARHVNQGNIGFADGSVWQADNNRLKKLIATSIATNRLAIP